MVKVKKAGPQILVACLLVLGLPMIGWSTASMEWLMFRKNAERTGFTEGMSCINHPDSVMKKWEFNAGAGITFSSPAIGNINNDSLIEVVIGCDDYKLYALRGDNGTLLWTYTTGLYIQSSPLLIDLDGDDTLEIVFASFDGKVYAVDGYGDSIWCWTTGDLIFSSPVGGDIDLDGAIDIAIGSFDDWVYVLNGMDGSLKWSYKTGGDIYSSPALGDLNGDDTLEVVIGSDDCKLYCLQNGDTLWTYTANTMIRSTPALGDLDGDNTLDVAFGDGVFSGPTGYLYGLDGQTGLPLWPPINVGWVDRASPGLADIDNDSLLEIIIGTGGGELLYAIEGESGTVKWAINPTSPTSWMIRTSPAIADIDGNGVLEILLGTHDYWCRAIKSTGDKLWGYWVKNDPHSGPALGDIDGDSLLEVVIATLAGDVFALDCKRRSGVEENAKRKTQNAKLEIYPNPFTQKTIIGYRLTNTEHRIMIYDLVGRLVKSFPITNNQSPITRISWDGKDDFGKEVRSGVYFCKLKAKERSEVKKIIKLR